MFGFFKKQSEEREQLKIEEENKRKEDEVRRQLVEEERKAIHYLELKLEKVKKMNQDRSVLIDGNLIITDDDINGHCISFGYNRKVHNMNGKFEIQTGQKADGLMPVLIGENDNMVDHFILSSFEYIRLKDFYSEVNKNIERRQDIFKDKLKEIVSNLKSNDEIYTICYNFISLNNQKMFYILEYTTALEKIIMLDSRIGIKTLFTENRELKDEIVLNEMKVFAEEQLFPLLKILSSRFPLSNDGQGVSKELFIVWKLLRGVAYDFFYKDFNEKYGVYFGDIWGKDIVDLVFIYTEIDSLEVDSLSNVSSFTYFLMKNGKLDEQDFFFNQSIIIKHLTEILKYKRLQQFENKLLNKSESKIISINDIDLMDGHEFEQFVGSLFSKMGYSAQVTKGSGDQGIDVIAEKNGKKYGIQAKCYSNVVSNKAIQEVAAGLSFYNLDKGIVVTNNYYTESARELAASNGIILWDRNMLKEKIEEIF